MTPKTVNGVKWAPKADDTYRDWRGTVARNGAPGQWIFRAIFTRLDEQGRSLWSLYWNQETPNGPRRMVWKKLLTLTQCQRQAGNMRAADSIVFIPFDYKEW